MSGLRHRRPWWNGLNLVAVAVVGLAGLATGPAYAAPPQYPAAPAPPLDPAVMAAQAGPTVVDVNTQMGYHSATSAGTGIVLDPNGVVLTNNHVISGATEVSAVAIANGQNYPADVIGFDRTHDIAVLQLHGASGLPAANIGSSAGVAIGEPVVAVGNTDGEGGAPSAVPGNVTGLNQTVSASDAMTGSTETLTDMIRSSTAIRPGDSGGPLINAGGQVIGMNTAASEAYKMPTLGGEGYAIPIDQAMAIAGAIRAGAASNTVHIGGTGFMGVGVVDYNGAGAKVEQVIPDTPAEQAGLSKDDVITAANGIPVDSAAALTNVLDQQHPGDTVTLTWHGPGGDRTAYVTLVPGPAG